MKTIKYIGFYDISGLNQNRNAQLSAINKMNYIINVLNECDYSVKIISPAWSKGKKIKSLKYMIDNNEYIMPASLKNAGLFKVINHIYSMIWLFVYLFFNCKKNEQVIVYHSLYLMFIVTLIKKLKKIRIILEVEEIYSDVICASEKFKKRELNFINHSDKYIWVSNMLRKTFDKNNCKYCVINGTYKTEKQITKKYNDGKIHLVYSGIIDYTKGAFNAIKLSEYLNEKYIIHIIGYGNRKIIEELNDEINKANKKNKCIVIYDGIKKDKEYIEYIQKCDVGLSIQDNNTNYNLTSFPSKILAYLSNGLRVVCVDLPAIKDSDIKDILYFYDGNSIKNISNVIKGIDYIQKYDSRELINKLNVNTKENIKELLRDEY